MNGRTILFSVEPTTVVVSVLSASSTLLVAAGKRNVVVIQNLSTLYMMTVSPGHAAVAGAGINLAPAADATHPGGSITFAGVMSAIYAIASGGAGANVSVTVI